MEKVKRSNKSIQRFREAAIAWQRLAAPKDDSPLSGFRYAIGRVLRSTEKANEDFTDKTVEINIECGASDKEGILQNDARGAVMFKPAEAKKRIGLVRSLENEEVEVGVYFAKVPPPLTSAQLFAFEGFVIAEQAEPTETDT